MNSSLKKFINQTVSEELNFYHGLKIILLFGLIAVSILTVSTIILLLISESAASTIWFLAVISFIATTIIYLVATYLEKEIIRKSNSLAIDYFKNQAKDILEKFLEKNDNSIIKQILADIESREIVLVTPRFKLISIRKPQVELTTKIDFKELEYIFKDKSIILKDFKIKDEKIIMDYLVNYFPCCFQVREFCLPLLSVE